MLQLAPGPANATSKPLTSTSAPADAQYHVACLNLDKAPEGNWICPQCLERRKRNPKSKKPSKAAKRR